MNTNTLKRPIVVLSSLRICVFVNSRPKSATSRPMSAHGSVVSDYSHTSKYDRMVLTRTNNTTEDDELMTEHIPKIGFGFADSYIDQLARDGRPPGDVNLIAGMFGEANDNNNR